MTGNSQIIDNYQFLFFKDFNDGNFHIFNKINKLMFLIVFNP